VNPAAERVLGRGQEEVVGHHYGEFLTGASRALMAERTRRALEGERVPPTVEVNILRKDGGLVLAEGQMSVLRDPQGQTTGWQVIYRDVTERRRAEEALRASEERYRSLVEGSIQGVYIHQDFVLKFVNRALARIFGYDEPADLVGGNLARLLAPHEVPRLQGYAAARLKGEPTPARYEVEGVRKDGTAIWVEVLPTVITWEGAPAILTTLHDITEQKRAEEALRQSREALIQAQKMEAVGRLAGGIAHDFNNLLTVITGRSDLLLRRLGPEDPARRDVELVKRTADRAAALTQQLLAFSRKQMLQPRVLDLNVTVDGMARLLHRLIGENIELATVLEPRLDPVCVDPAQIEQVLLNLVVNARDAMPEGGRLTITTANVTINEAFVAENRGAREGAHVLLSVRDTGHGMSPDVQAHIFEPFFTTKGVGKGTGLGLATVYGIVKQHDGYITVQSAPWEGTTVRVYLPRAEGAPAEAAAPPGVPATLAAGSETVLLVEDQDDLRDFAREVLAMAGYTVLEAAEPERAIALATGHPGPIDLLLTDVVMPQMSGRALAERLAPSRPGMKILYMTGYTDEAIVHHGVLDPGTLLLTKPFTPDVLTRRVQAVLKGTV
jgi:PAS domain S-box-containing protein